MTNPRDVNPTKTRAGRRPIALSDFLVDTFRRQQHQQKLARVAAGPDWQEGPWVFTTRRGTWYSPRNIHRDFKTLLKHAELPNAIRIHDLRHAMATFWLANGVPVKSGV